MSCDIRFSEPMSDNAMACGFENRQIAVCIAYDLP